MKKIIWLEGVSCTVLKTVNRRYSVKQVFLKISQNSQGNTCAKVYFLIKAEAWNFFKK